jgi:hypothetical protein
MVMTRRDAERAKERVAVLITPTEKAADVDRASSLGLSLGQFFREVGAAYMNRIPQRDEEEILEAALKESLDKRSLSGGIEQKREPLALNYL